MNKLTLRQLNIFVAVAERKSLAAAGRHLRLSQATLSEALRSLEGNLGKMLFDRTNRRLQLTPSGRAFLKDAKSLLASSEALFHRYAGRAMLLCGASVTVGNYILPPVLISLCETHPELQIDLVVRNTEGITRMLLNREIHAAVVEGQVTNAQLLTTAWREDELAIFAAPTNPLVTGASITDLAEAEWILREVGSGTRESFDAAAQDWPNLPKVAINAGGNEFIKRAVASGNRLGCLSRAAVSAEVERGELAFVPVGMPPIVRTLTFVRRRDAIEDPLLPIFMEALGVIGGG